VIAYLTGADNDDFQSGNLVNIWLWLLF